MNEIPSDVEKKKSLSFFRTVLPNTGWLGLVVLIQCSGSTLLLPVLVRYLSPNDFGIIASVALLSTGVSVFADWGWGIGMTRNFFDYNKEERGSMLFTLLVFVTLTTMLLFVSTALLLAHFAQEIIVSWKPEYTNFLYIQFFTTALTYPSLVIGNYLVVSQRIKVYASRNIVTYILSIVVLVILLVVFNYGILAVFLSNAINALLTIGLSLVIIKQDIRVKFDFSFVKSVWKIGWANLPQSVFQYLTRMGDRWIIQALMPLSHLGLYSLGARFEDVSSSFSQSLKAAWRPVNLRMLGQEENNQALKRQAGYYVEITTIVVVGLSLFAKEAIWLLTTPNFYDAYVVVPFLLIGSLFLTISIVPHTFLLYEKKVYLTVLAFIPSAIVQIGVAWILVPQLGMVGAAIGSGLSYILYTLLLLFFAFYFTERVLQLPSFKWVFFLVIGTLVSLIGAIPNSSVTMWFVTFKIIIFLGVIISMALFEKDAIRLFFVFFKQNLQVNNKNSI